MIKECILHTKTILTHKKEVFKLTIISGIPLQGIVHDFSKFSPTEFCESIKYFTGDRSPIMNCKDVNNGVSMAWLHHKGRNKHHAEYWVDKLYSGGVPMQMEYRYVVEMCCDIIAASKTYNGNNYTQNMPYDYWTSKLKDTTLLHEKSRKFVAQILKDYSKHGEKALYPCHTKRIYTKIEKSL